jgi:nucleotide-binding universal stress UspA family protein
MKIFWTFDPFEDNKALRKKGASLLKSIRQSGDSVIAVYVASDEELTSARGAGKNAGKRFSDVAADQVRAQLIALGLKDVGVSIASEPRFSLTAAVRKLVDHVAGQKADLLISSTHGRTGMKRFLLGSFAETLIHFAKTDLVLFNEKTEVPLRAPRRLLYAHDFSRKGDEGFKRALGYANSWGSELHVVHVPQPSFAVRFEGQDPAVETYRKKVRAKVNKVEAALKEADVRGSVSLLTQTKALTDLIQATARKVDADMILASAQAGRLAALLGGSVTRNLIRESRIPTLVMKL